MGSYAELAIVGGRNATTSAAVLMTSPDGITWTEVTGYTGGANSVGVAGDTYFAGGAAFAATSGDGVTWPTFTAPYLETRIAWTGSKWIAVERNSSWTSTNGTTWTSAASTGSFHLSRRVLHAGGVTVSTGLSGGGGTPTVIHSTNEGTSWSTYTPSSGSNEGQDLAYGAGRWVIPRRRIGGSPADVGFITSTNGTSWSVVDTGIAASNGWFHAAYGNGIFLFVGVENSGTIAVATSTTGTANSFTKPTSTGLPFTSTAGRLTFWNGRFLYVNFQSDGNIYSSTNGTTWTSTSFANRVWTDISAGVARPRGGIYRDGAVHLS